MRQLSHIKPLLNYSRLTWMSRNVCKYSSHSVNSWSNVKDVHCEAKVGESKLTFSSGKMARFADASAVAQIGDTAVMVTAVSRSTSQLTEASFLPLTVDYRHKSAAAGRIPTTAARREAPPSGKEILTSRIIDKSIRPLFPPGFVNETQIICNLLAWDSLNDPDVIGLNATSAALAISNIPWHGPVGAVRIGCVDGELVVNPSRKQLSNSSLNLVISSTQDGKVTMIDASAENIEVTEFKKAIQLGVSQAQVIADAITNFAAEHGKEKRQFIDQSGIASNIAEAMEKYAKDEIRKVFTDFTHHKLSRDQEIGRIRVESTKRMCKDFPGMDNLVFDEAFSQLSKQVFKDLVFETDIRCDGRKLNELRAISCSVDLFKPLHGSAIFQRGQTQVFCTAALGSVLSSIRADAMAYLTDGGQDKNFFLHYQFPPYATNEVGKGGNVNRRELGHGSLAEKALRPVIPSDLQYTVRLTAEVFESNGSSSLASVCAGSLALMDAGVKISDPVAGVAIGLLARLDETTKKIKDYRILTDILGLEDYAGDMDFKIAGTKTGITALQADVKIPGLPMSIVMEAIDRGCTGIDEILGIMAETLPAPRCELKDNHPVVEKLDIAPNKITRFIGVGGFNVNKLRMETGVETLSSDQEIGKYELFAPNQLAMDEAKVMIEEILAADESPELVDGDIYKVTILEIVEYGIKVQIHDKLGPGFVHNSQLDQRRVVHASALGFEVGQQIYVKYLGRDPADGYMRLSRKAVMSTGQGVKRDLMAYKKKQLELEAKKIKEQEELDKKMENLLETNT